MSTDQSKKINRYHFEEICLILFILATDLRDYDKDDLVLFTEDIEGTIDHLFAASFLASLPEYINSNKEEFQDFERIRAMVIALYDSQWHKKLIDPNVMNEVKSLAKQILSKLNIQYVEPNKYKESHLNIDW